MIILQGNKYIVSDTSTKEVISVHEFDPPDRKSMTKAERDARESNARWKETK